MLSPFGRRHWLESYRGVRLRYPAGARAPAAVEVRSFLLAHLDREKVRFEGLENDGRAGTGGA